MEKKVIEGLHYDLEEGIEASENNRLLTSGIETSRVCNLKCIYCAWDSGNAIENEVKFDEIKDYIQQAKDLGAKSITVIGGGEPTLYKNIYELIDFIHSNNLIPVIITNGQIISEEMASFLKSKNTSVVLKMDSLKKNVQDYLAGVDGAYENIMNSFKNLEKFGYTEYSESGITKLGIAFVVTKLNIDEIPELWRFARRKNIYPNLEVLNIKEGRALKNIEDLRVEETQIDKLIGEIEKIEREEFGYFSAEKNCQNKCQRHRYSSYLNVSGFIQPCSAIRIKEYNIKEKPLKEILENSFYKKLRCSSECISGQTAQAMYSSQD